MNKPRRRTFSNTELIRAIRADRRGRAKERREHKARRRPVFFPPAGGPSLRDLLRRELGTYGAKGRTVAGFARSPWIGGEPAHEIDNTRR